MTGAYRRAGALALLALSAGAASGCGQTSSEPSLAKSNEPIPIPDVPVPPADGPKLGAVANITPVYDRPATSGNLLGYLHAGARVARAERPFTSEGCSGGWYPVRPRGFVCAGQSATTDPNHPTLVAMAVQPKLDESMPYAYARATVPTPVYKVDSTRDQAVAEAGKLAKGSAMAVVGSWEAKDGEGTPQRLAMLTDGRFVRAADLEAAKPSEFAGAELDDQHTLPMAFVVKQGVRAWVIEEQTAEKRALLDYHGRIDLTGKFRTLSDLRFWETPDGRWVRHKDVTVVRRRHEFPAFAKEGQKWIDVSVVTGTLVLYEGKKPVFVTLASVGRDRIRDEAGAAITQRGEFFVTGKQVTGATIDGKTLAEGKDLLDVPWVVELSSGQSLFGAYFHDRFGIEDGSGHIQVSPADAHRIWRWVDVPLHEGWHGVKAPEKADVKTIVNVRK